MNQCDNYSWDDVLKLKLIFAKTPGLSEFTYITIRDIYIKNNVTGTMRKVASTFADKASLFIDNITKVCICNNLLSEVAQFNIGTFKVFNKP